MDFSDNLVCDKDANGVALLTLNRPGSRNALSGQLRADIVDCLAGLEADDGVSAVVVIGSGEVFCAGFDLKELGEGDAHAIFAEAQIYHRKVHTFRKPLIAAVNGPAFAGGMDLALMCDIRLGCDATQFGQPQVRMGIPAAFDLVRSVVDEGTARYLCLTGSRMSAGDALTRGLLSRLFTDRAELQTEALACAATIAQSNAGAAMKSRFIEAQPGLFDS
jgi:enoyl-CoA hydratase